MIELKRILIATDFSDHAKVAMQYAGALADVFEAELILCHVIATEHWLSQLPPGGEGYFPPNFSELEENKTRNTCQQLIAELGIKDGRVIIPHGSPFVEIIKAARSEDADLIVIGTHGRGAVAHMLLGSVAEKVVRKAPCPVLTVREGEHDFVLP